jgi:hypothetical protein
MAKRPKKNKSVSASEKEYKKLSKKVENELNKVNENEDFNVTKGTDISNSQSKKAKKSNSRKASKEKKINVSKSVKDMTREELIKTATSTAQHSNKTLREYEKADKDHLYVHGKLLAIAEKYDIKTRGNRVSRSFKKLTDNQLRDFITEAKQTYTGKSVKAVSSEFDKRRAITTDMLKNRFSGLDESKLNNLSDSQFNEFYERLSAGKVSKDGRQYTSNEIIVNTLIDLGLMNEDWEDEYALAFQKQREANERLNRNKAIKNRNRGRKR